jgi:hypothetical protein
MLQDVGVVGRVAPLTRLSPCRFQVRLFRMAASDLWKRHASAPGGWFNRRDIHRWVVARDCAEWRAAANARCDPFNLGSENLAA